MKNTVLITTCLLLGFVGGLLSHFVFPRSSPTTGGGPSWPTLIQVPPPAPSPVPSVLASCEVEILGHCSDVRPGEGRLLKCLEQKMGDQLSVNCRQTVDRLRQSQGKLNQ